MHWGEPFSLWNGILCAFLQGERKHNDNLINPQPFKTKSEVPCDVIQGKGKEKEERTYLIKEME